MVFRSISEKCLLEEMCLELKVTLKNGIKNVQEALLPITKIFANDLETIFKAVFNADSKSVFSFFLSCLERQKIQLKLMKEFKLVI